MYECRILYIFADMKNELTISSLAEIDKVAERFLEMVGRDRLIAFYAPMGAGKTTFSAALCRVLGVGEDSVGSPTFSIVNEYRCADGTPLFHFDFYRINNIAEALDIGFYDYVDSGYMCLMEWPENIEPLLPEETLKVTVSVREDGSRVLSWED